MSPVPDYDADLYSDDAIVSPYAHYQALRELGPVVRLPRHDVLAISRWSDVRDVLLNHEVFSSAHGIALNADVNSASIGNTVTSDPPEHTQLRSLVRKPLAPPALQSIAPRIQAEADALVARLLTRGSFDAMADFAQHLPVTIVSELVGLPDEGRSKMLQWATATFNALGPMNERARTSLPDIHALRDYCQRPETIEALKPDGWAAAIWAAGRGGRIPLDRCPVLMRDYVSPSLDTTIMATGSLLWLLGRHPDQWERLRQDPSLIPGAINEAVRLESPIRGFARHVTRDCDIGGSPVRAGSRLLVLYASANRDERKWRDPERFDILRDVRDHLGFGFGAHICVGMHLARLEMTALLTALVRQVRHIEVGEPRWALNNVIHGIESMHVTVH